MTTTNCYTITYWCWYWWSIDFIVCYLIIFICMTIICNIYIVCCKVDYITNITFNIQCVIIKYTVWCICTYKCTYSTIISRVEVTIFYCYIWRILTYRKSSYSSTNLFIFSNFCYIIENNVWCIFYYNLGIIEVKSSDVTSTCCFFKYYCISIIFSKEIRTCWI